MINDIPLTRNLGLALVVLTALFVAIGADPADRLPLGLGVLYWLTHIGFGLAAAVIAVHRSFWVATAHVRRMVKGPYGWTCELSNGSKVPVSRRRVSEVKQRLNLA